jgi:hypothetical protein
MSKGSLQNQDFKSVAELEAQGLSNANAKEAMLNDSKVYVTSLSKTLDEAIADDDIGGGGGGGGDTVNRNEVINGNFDFWQRGTSLSAATGIRFLADRFRTSAGSGATLALSRQSFTLGQTDVPNNPKYFHRFVADTSSPASGTFAVMNHRMEDVTKLSGESVTLSFWAKADASKPMSVEFNQNFGTGGSPSASENAIGVEKINLTTSWVKYVVTAAIPSVTGKTLGTDGNDFLEFNFWMSAGSDRDARTDTLGNQSGTFDIAQIKLERGNVATDFVLAGDTIAGELAACRRYYEKLEYGTDGIISTAVIQASGSIDGMINFSEKRIIPTVTSSLSTTHGWMARIKNTNTSISVAPTFFNRSKKTARIIASFSHGTGANGESGLFLAVTSGNAFIELDAEL